MSSQRSSNARPDGQYWRSPLEELLASDVIPPHANARHIEQAPTIIGQPEKDVTSWTGPQQYQDTCAIKCQQLIIQQFTGKTISEEELVIEAMERGWYRPGEGTPIEHLGNLLESHGIAVNRYIRANVLNLAAELGQGHKVIVAVDSRELWDQHPLLRHINELLDNVGFANANHAILVSAIDTRDWPEVYVIVSDPGTGRPLERYPLEQFLSAWGDSEFFMVATQEPVPRHVPEMIHFDYTTGHLPTIANEPWDALIHCFIIQPQLFHKILDDYVSRHEWGFGAGFSSDDPVQGWEDHYDQFLGDEGVLE